MSVLSKAKDHFWHARLIVYRYLANLAKPCLQCCAGQHAGC